MLAEHQSLAAERLLELLRLYGGALLADEVGLGKSFVAAEVMRRSAGALELIVPAALIEQWRETLARFGIAATLFTHDGIVAAPFVPERRERLLVVDEAHAFRNPHTRRYEALARRSVGARLLLVTATPVCNSARDLESLLRLFARDDLLRDAGVPSIDRAFEVRDSDAIAAIVGALVIRRDRSVLPDALQFGALERRVVVHPVLDASLIDELRFPLTGEEALLRRFLRRRLESSEAAFIESVRRQLRFYERALGCIAAGRTLPKRDYRRLFGREEDRDAFQEVLFWDLFAPPGSVDAGEIREEMARLDALLALARAAPCEKRALLVDLVRGEREPLLIFTGSAATARDLHEALRGVRACGLVTSRERSREAVLRAFIDRRLDIVVSTDMAAEGLNLQRAGTVVHYDIPWNPVKLEQRNGRAHRIGQSRDCVRAIYFVPRSRGALPVVARKNRVRRALLVGASAPHVASTLRPRLARDAAYLRFADAAARAGLRLPESLARRHKAGIELLLDAMSREYLDQRRLDELLAVVDV
ncbi:MAG TPA: helicase-related protein [Thermoanaerobaculia bacterium]